MQYLTPKAVPLDETSLLRSVRLGADADPDDIDSVQKLALEAFPLARPHAVYDILAVAVRGEDYIEFENGVRYTSPLVVKNLENCHVCVPYIATCGTELADWARAYRSDFMTQYWADAVMLGFLGQALAALRETVREGIFKGPDFSAMNPGSLPVWPIAEQRVLFASLGGTEAPDGGWSSPAGVRLTPDCLMIPAKSVSGFFFTSQKGYVNCRLCPRKDCPNRRAPYEKQP